MIKVDSVKYGEIKISGKTYYSDVILYWDGKAELRKKSHRLSIEECNSILKKKPYGIVIGTGLEQKSLDVPEKTEYLIIQHGVKLFIDSTTNALEIFNAFISDKKKIVGVFHTSL